MRIPRRLPIYPWNDNEPIYFGTGSDVAMYWDGTYLRFDGSTSEILFRLSTAGVSYFYGGTVAGDDLYLRANTVDAMPYIQLMGSGSLILGGVAGYSCFNLQISGTGNFMYIGYVSPDILFTALAEKNIYLKPSGAGRVKFGAYTAGVASDSTGYIDILDAGGNVRKLMVQA